jgi:hypothetical protein
MSTIIFPAPTFSHAAMKSIGMDKISRNSWHILMPTGQGLTEAEALGVKAHDAYDRIVRDGFELYGGSISTLKVPSARDNQLLPSPADPSMYSAARKKIADTAERHRLLGWETVETMEELKLPGNLCVSPSTLTAFRRSLAERYDTLAALNAAWGTVFSDWRDVRPSNFANAAKAKNLAPWFEHRLFMDTLIADWHRKCEAAYRQAVPGGRVGVWAPFRMAPDTGCDTVKLMRSTRSHMQYAGSDTERYVDMSYADAERGLWLPICYDRNLPEGSEREGFMWPHRYLMDQCGVMGVWWGFERFQWPFIEPDFTPNVPFKNAMGEIDQLKGGIDRLILNARLDYNACAVLFSQESSLMADGLKRLDQASPLTSHWKSGMHIFYQMQIRPKIIPAGDVVYGQLQRDRIKYLFLPGILCMSDPQISAVKQFVKDGGVVIADVLPGQYQLNSRPRKTNPLSEIFAKPADNVSGATLSPMTSIFGKGKTMLLNTCLSFPGRNPRGPEITRLAKIADIVQKWTPIKAPVTFKGDTPHPGHVRYYTYKSLKIIAILDTLQKEGERTYDIQLPGKAYAVNLIGKPSPSHGTQLKGVIPKYRAQYIVLSRTAPSPLAVKETVSPAAIELSLKGSGDHLVVVEVTDSQGQRNELSQEKEFTESTTLRIPLAENDPKGEWVVSVKDILSGKTITKKVAR